MATRQYIGARYTPKFVGTYDATRAYEALEVVDNGSGTTYISKQSVPPNTPLTNTTYWLVYGSSNGAILDLQDRVSTIEGEIPVINSSILRMSGEISDINGDISDINDDISDIETSLNNTIKRDDLVVCVSDSYGVRTNNWIHWLGLCLGIDSDHLIDLSANGFGFTSDRFKSLITPGATAYSISEDVDPLRVTKIIVGGGFNDRNLDVEEDIASFMSYAKTQYPNATVYIGFIGWSFNASYLVGFAQSKGFIAYTNCTKYGAYYLNGVENIMKNKSLYELESPAPGITEPYNYVHPNASGSEKIGIYMANAIKTGACDIIYPYIIASYEAANAGDTFTGTFTQQLHNSNVYVLNDGMSISNSNGITLNASTPVKIAKGSGTGSYIALALARSIPVKCRFSGGSYSDPVIDICWLKFQDGDIYLDTVGQPNGTCTQIIIYRFNTVIGV